MEAITETPVPPQHTQAEAVDFRNAAHGPRGYKVKNKRKLDEFEEQAAEDEASTAMLEPGSAPPQRKRAKLNTVGIGKGSGRPWKEPGERAGSLKNPQLATPWEEKMKIKAEKKAFLTVKREAMAAHKEKLARARKQREEARARKEENRKKSSITQVVSSNATLKKMMKSKKQRKLLQKADTMQLSKPVAMQQ